VPAEMPAAVRDAYAGTLEPFPFALPADTIGLVRMRRSLPALWSNRDALVAERDPYCRGIVLLGLSAPIDALAQGFAAAAASRTCRGFAVGRTIFHDASRAWLAGELDDAGLVAGVRKNFEALIDAWTATRPKEPRR